jgi:phage terminase large subunit-like protein
MVESALRTVEMGLPVRLVHARGSKSARAQPVAALFETGQAKLAGRFRSWRTSLQGSPTAAAIRGRRSPDRADATAWAMSELFRPRVEPRIRSF